MLPRYLGEILEGRSEGFVHCLLREQFEEIRPLALKNPLIEDNPFSGHMSADKVNGRQKLENITRAKKFR